MRRFAAILAFASLSATAELELKTELTAETGVRTGGRFDVNRTSIQPGAKLTLGSVELDAELRAYRNFSASNHGLTKDEVSIRVLKASYWGEGWGATAGFQQVTWSETFGFQPLDIVNARNFVDFGPLDHGRNRIAAPNLNVYVDIGPLKVTGYLTPFAQKPKLPEGIRQGDEKSVEGGVRVSTTLSDTSASAFVYRHLTRFPTMEFGLGYLQARYRPVTSFGGSVSKGLREFVLRGDSIVTPGDVTTYSVVAGADYSPETVDDFTVGVQAQVDRFAFADAKARPGVSLMARTGFFGGKLELDARAFRRLSGREYWLQAGSRLRIGNDWEWRVLGEALTDGPSSPFSFLGYAERVSTQVSYFF